MFKYYDGQLDYLARVGVKDYGLVAGDVGTGKSLFMISLIRLKLEDPATGKLRAPALIIAPGGTLRETEADDGERTPAQWLAEVEAFAPGIPVRILRSFDDYKANLAEDGSLPPGIYMTYYEAWFRNGARESVPPGWLGRRGEYVEKTHVNFCHAIRHLGYGEGRWMTGALGRKELIENWSEGLGRSRNGIRCIALPSLCEQVMAHCTARSWNERRGLAAGTRSQDATGPDGGDATPEGLLPFSFVGLDEAHVCTNLDAQVTRAFLRIQAQYRFAFTATPIPNLVSNLFPLIGWLAVPGWYRGGRRNVAWPYAVEDEKTFNDTFLSIERDHTAEEMAAKSARRMGKGAARKVVKFSPIISSPARLLKLISPTVAYISKEDCNPAYRAPQIMDMRVPMSLGQAKLYEHFLDRANIEGDSPLVRALKQSIYLRDICADPAGFDHGGPVPSSGMTPKILLALQLVRDHLAAGEQTLLICSRVGQTNELARRLRETGIRYARIDSTMAPDGHTAEANRFKSGEVPVLLMGLKCAAGHSFPKCRNNIICSNEWSWGPFKQASGRNDRVNSVPGIRIWALMHASSIEEAMFDRCATKGDAATICLRGQRVPRDFVPVDPAEVLTAAMERWEQLKTAKGDLGFVREGDCEEAWSKLAHEIALNGVRWRRIVDLPANTPAPTVAAVPAPAHWLLARRKAA